MSLKFEPEDFPPSHRITGYATHGGAECGKQSYTIQNEMLTSDEAVKYAQKKFDKWILLNGIRVARSPSESHGGIWTESKGSMQFQIGETHKAILINIEPIERCRHVNSKIRAMTDSHNIPGDHILSPTLVFARGSIKYLCECGVMVLPKEFEEIK